jgi:hypothetical protein
MTTSNSQQKSFIATLFDFGITSYLTVRFLKVIYAIIVVLVLLTGLFILIGALSTGITVNIIAAIIFAPLVTLVYLVLARIAVEVITMFFRIGDNTSLAVQLLGGGRAPGQWGQGAQPGYGPPAAYGSQAPWGYQAGAGDNPGAPMPAPYGAGSPPANYGQPQANYGQQQPNYGQPQGPYGQPQPTHDQPQDNAGDPYAKPEPPAQPGQQGWGPTNPTP